MEVGPECFKSAKATAAEPEDVDDLTKIAKEKTNALKVKDSAIKIKLEIAKLQNDIIKHSGDAEAAMNERSGGKVDINDLTDKLNKL